MVVVVEPWSHWWAVVVWCGVGWWGFGGAVHLVIAPLASESWSWSLRRPVFALKNPPASPASLPLALPGKQAVS